MVEIAGILKLSLLDYPSNTCCTVFMSGCNFMCPFCHNSSLVVDSKSNQLLSEEEIFNFLKKRQGLLDGVCITGGEPLLQKDLIPFIKRIKELGFKVKLDTNGYLFDKLKEIIDLKLVDYIAMDVKSGLTNYSCVSGLKEMDLERIKSSIKLIMESSIDYEFRTTVVKGLHKKEDFLEVRELIKGSKRYFLQEFKDSEYVIKSGVFESFTLSEMEEFKKIIEEYSIKCEIRGID